MTPNSHRSGSLFPAAVTAVCLQQQALQLLTLPIRSQHP